MSRLQQNKPLHFSQKKVDLAQKELDLNKGNHELQLAVLIEAETELVDIEERITGQRSEQLTNQNSLLREQTERVAEDTCCYWCWSFWRIKSISWREQRTGCRIEAIIDTYAGASKAFAQGGVLVL